MCDSNISGSNLSILKTKSGIFTTVIVSYQKEFNASHKEMLSLTEYYNRWDTNPEILHVKNEYLIFAIMHF